MKKLLLTLSLSIVSAFGLKAQVVYNEDFDGIGGSTAGGPGTYTFAPGMLLRNVDNKTPATNVAYVNDAWERREDFSFNVGDSCAFSTSWYTPAGAANDFMWTPAITALPANCVLSWNAVAYDAAYPDGYEVRIMTVAPTGGTGVIGNQITNSTVLFSIPAENTAWTARTVSLSAYAGQTVYIGFRNLSNDMFLLLIDDIKVEAQVTIDAQLTFADTATPYTLIPQTQTGPLTFNGTIRNNGLNSLSNVSAHVNVFNGSTNVYSANSTTTTTLAPAATVNWTVAPFTPSGIGTYTVQFIANQTSGTDQTHGNDTLYQNFVVTDSTYARDNGVVTGGIGIGAGNGGYVGQDFDITNTDLVTSILVYVTTGYTGEPMAAVIWNMSGGVPTTIAVSTDTLIYPDDSARVYTLPIHGAGYILNPGQYAVTFVEFDSTMQLAQTADIFTSGHTWVNWPTSPSNGWANLEDFGPAFARASVIRPNFGDVCLNNTSTITSTQASCITCADGSATVTASGTNGNVTYAWSPSGGNAATATGLATGMYMVTITDAFGCVISDTVNVAYDVCGLFSATANPTSSTCQTCQDGSAQVTVSGNNGNVSYAWSNGGTSDSIQNVLAGNYFVVVSDSLGCSDTLSVNIGYGICGSFAATSVSTNASCGSCADGSASVSVVGNNGPLTYLWSNGGTSDTIQNVLPGTYVVVITDSAGCSTSDTVVVQFGTEIQAVAEGTFASVFPNPSNGTFQINLNFEQATNATITVINTLGEVVATQKVSGMTNGRVDMKLNAAPGMYSVRITTPNEEVILPMNIVK